MLVICDLSRDQFDEVKFPSVLITSINGNNRVVSVPEEMNRLRMPYVGMLTFTDFATCTCRSPALHSS